MASLHVSQELI